MIVLYIVPKRKSPIEKANVYKFYSLFLKSSHDIVLEFIFAVVLKCNCVDLVIDLIVLKSEPSTWSHASVEARLAENQERLEHVLFQNQRFHYSGTVTPKV